MARRSVLMLVLGAVAVSACVSVQTSAPTTPAIPDFTFNPPSLPPVIVPTLPPLPTLPPPPIATPQPTATAEQPTPPPTLEPTEEPERTLAPGETPQPSPLDISELLTSTMSVVNLTDGPVSATVDLFNEGEKVGTVAKLDIEPYGALDQNVPAATYLISITVGTADPVTCEITIAENAEVDFAVAGTDILVTTPAAPPAAPDDIFIESSPLCA